MQDVERSIQKAEAVASKLQDSCQRIRELEVEKESICCQVKDIEEEISRRLAEMDLSMKSEAIMPKAKMPKAKNPNEHTLLDILVWLIGSQKMRVPSVLAVAAQDFGFVTSSKNFRAVVHQALRQNRRFTKIRSGVWGLSPSGSMQYARQCRYKQMK